MQQININELKPHPRNNEFFDDIVGDKWQELLDSIEKRIKEGKRGNIEPIVITQDKVIVAGHQRVRAFKELGIPIIDAEIRIYDTDDEILLDLLESNIRRRGDVGGSAKKMGMRIWELERLYGIRNGSTSFQGNQYTEVVSNKSEAPTQEQLASQMGISVDTLQNYKLLSDMIPELSDLVDTGIVTKTTALAMMRNLSETEQEELISSMDTTKKLTQREIQKYIDEIRELKNAPPKVVDNTDHTKVEQLKCTIRDLQSEKSILERKVKLNQEDSDRFNKLKSDIDFLTKQKSNLGRQIDSATELSELTVTLQRTLEQELAPIKFKRCIEVLDSSDVCVDNLIDIIGQVDKWSNEMKKMLPIKYDYVVDVQ